MTAQIMLVFGTRPEAIKMLPVVKALKQRPSLKVVTTVTAQHRQMLDQVFEAFGEKPDIDLDLMAVNQTLGGITSKAMMGVGAVLEQHKPDLVLVHGDTTTAMAAAMAAFYARIPIGHVEAGLRSYDLARPWPEEFNRVVVDSIAHYMFAPTKTASENLRREYQHDGKVFVTGNTGIDALLHVARNLDATEPVGSENFEAPVKLDPARRLVLVTGHRRESFGGGFERICDALARIGRRDNVQVVYPVHLNPQVKDVVEARLGNQSNISLIAPVGYIDMVRLMRRASIILTDSGGIQEEGPALGRPVLVMRDITERPEALSTGVVKLVGTDPDVIEREVSRLLDDDDHYRATARPVFPYGDGTAATQIAAIIEEAFGR